MYNCRNKNCIQPVHINGAECPVCVGPKIDPAAYGVKAKTCTRHNNIDTTFGCRDCACEMIELWTRDELKSFEPVQESTEEFGITSPTGSLRFNTGKPQSNEISPKFLLDMGAVLEKSRQKYPRGNWAKGNSYSVPFDSMMRHILAWQSGESVDSESGQSHLAHAALNLMMLHYYEEMFPEFDDRIFKKDKK